MLRFSGRKKLGHLKKVWQDFRILIKVFLLDKVNLARRRSGNREDEEHENAVYEQEEIERNQED